MARFTILISFLLALLPFFLHAQRFSAGAILGLNASQIDGDDQFGYRQLGLAGGLQGAAQLSSRLSLNVELLYSRRGARASSREKGRADYSANIQLQYVETPFLLDYKLLENWDGFYFLHLHSGFQYARLLEAEVKERITRPLPDNAHPIGEQQTNFNHNELGWIFGLSWYPFPKGYISLRHVLGLTPLLEGQDTGIRQLRSFYLQLGVGYKI